MGGIHMAVSLFAFTLALSPPLRGNELYGCVQATPHRKVRENDSFCCVHAVHVECSGRRKREARRLRLGGKRIMVIAALRKNCEAGTQSVRDTLPNVPALTSALPICLEAASPTPHLSRSLAARAPPKRTG